MSHSSVRSLTILCMLLLPSLAFAQATGQITGLVTDPSGSVVANAAVDVINQATGQVRSVVSGNDGFYTVPLVNPGAYQVKASAPGFSTLVRNGITVSVGETVAFGTYPQDHRVSSEGKS